MKVGLTKFRIYSYESLDLLYKDDRSVNDNEYNNNHDEPAKEYIHLGWYIVIVHLLELHNVIHIRGLALNKGWSVKGALIEGHRVLVSGYEVNRDMLIIRNRKFARIPIQITNSPGRTSARILKNLTCFYHFSQLLSSV